MAGLAEQETPKPPTCPSETNRYEPLSFPTKSGTKGEPYPKNQIHIRESNFVLHIASFLKFMPSKRPVPLAGSEPA